jgi:hypothetical protein
MAAMTVLALALSVTGTICSLAALALLLLG